jgi:hypothetical protein
MMTMMSAGMPILPSYNLSLQISISRMKKKLYINNYFTKIKVYFLINLRMRSMK